ncbi:hypothetical protein JOF56_009154 [Kibdelosporangium banguiense]|uniref:Cardiolipin synthase N-terminal domain-containing protein n=1 Tax=Kibdelosporangium banguiense TaxID=1365924 RepID=A0ABS4TWI3_9PSEU|nr:PLD nuclease N-terminal domain-containing protein [Kibdelosporangium banguiense]MBP2328769.1 hypothetical protein [Kibdelosporangium banguiense]
MAAKKWRDLEPRQRRTIVATGAVQVGLAVSAWYDLSRRPQELVNGPKLLWALVIAINFVGPSAYFRFGRHQPITHKATPWHERAHLTDSVPAR